MPLLPEVFLAAFVVYGVVLLVVMAWKGRRAEEIEEVTAREELRGARALVREILSRHGPR